MFERSTMVSKQNIGMSQYLHNLVVQRLCLLIRRQVGLEKRGVDTFVLCELRDKLVSLALGGWGRVVDCDGAAVLGKQPSGRQAYSPSAVGRSVYAFLHRYNLNLRATGDQCKLALKSGGGGHDLCVFKMTQMVVVRVRVYLERQSRALAKPPLTFKYSIS